MKHLFTLAVIALCAGQGLAQPDTNESSPSEPDQRLPQPSVGTAPIPASPPIQPAVPPPAPVPFPPPDGLRTIPTRTLRQPPLRHNPTGVPQPGIPNLPGAPAPRKPVPPEEMGRPMNLRGHLDPMQERNSRRALIITTAQLADKTREEMEEDMAVMSRLLEKAAESFRQQVQRSGAPLLHIGSDSSASPHLYLEGYGVLFTLNHSMPLVPAEMPDAVKKEEPKEKSELSAWEQARKEMMHSRPGAAGPAGDTRPVRYDPHAVASLKEELLKALKDASHLRHLKPEENVAVAVFAHSQSTLFQERPPLKIGEREMPQPAQMTFVQIPAARQAVVSIRVKKSDVDAFAKGEIDFEKFSQKAAMLAY